MTKPHDDIQAATEAIEQGNMIYNGHLYSVVCNEYLSALKAQQAPDLDSLRKTFCKSKFMHGAPFSTHYDIAAYNQALDDAEALLKGKDDG